MRRAQGRLLGAAIVEWRSGRTGDPRHRFREAVRYLAAFQAWRVSVDKNFPRVCGPTERAAFRGQLEKVGRRLNMDAPTRHLLAAVLDRFVSDGMPAVAKKDPHPGNWLWTRRNELVLIDIEGTVALPLLHEAVTVIDDLPLLDLDDVGWTEREGLCRDYIHALEDFGFPSYRRAVPANGMLRGNGGSACRKGIG